MATLYFKVSSDYDEVIRLRKECEKLEAQLKKMDVNKTPASARALEAQLTSAKQKMMGLATEAAKAGAVMERDFKNSIYNASQTVNNLSENITSQRGVIRQLQNELTLLKEKYRETVKSGGDTSGMPEQIKAQTVKLREQKDILFGLTQQQAEARLSVKRLKDEYASFKEEAGETVTANEKMSLSLKKVLGVIGGISVLKQFASEIIRVRGEFQSMETAIETMVGKDTANQIFPQIKELAKISPLTMSDMVSAEKMMLGFNIQVEDTIKYLQALSDISMGDSVKFNSLTLAFSQMSAAGKLMGQDLNQMINAGFNPLQVISEKTGKSIATLKDEMSKGAVSAEMVQEAFIDATSAGGKFYQMSENASKTINGQISMMQDALDTAFNEIGQASEGIIMKGIQATTSLIQNYETVGKVLLGLIATYGTYKTATLLVWTIEQARAKTLWTSIAATKALTVAQTALNTVMKANPYVLVATAIAGLVTAMWAYHDSTTEAEKAQARINEREEEARKLAEEHKQEIDKLIESSRDLALSDLERGRSLAALREEYPKIFAQYDIETIKLTDILKLKQQIAEEDARRAGLKKKQEFKDIENEIVYYENLLRTLSGQQGVDGYVKKLKDLRAERDILMKDKGKGISELFISSLKNIDIENFDIYIKELEKRISGKGNDAKIKMRLPIDAKGALSDEAIYDVKEIKNLISTVKSAQKARIETEKNHTTYQQDLLKAKQDWLKAKAGYEALIKDQKATTEQVTKAREEMESKEKTYKDLGGSTTKQKTNTRNDFSQENVIKTYSEKLRSLEKQQAIERAKEAVDLENQVEQARIDAMIEGGDKIIAQHEFENKKELQAIDKAKEEYIQKEIQRQKEIFEATEELKAKKNPNYKKKSFDSSSVTVDTSSFDMLKEYTFNKQLREELNAQKEAMNAYLAEYGTYMQKRQAIIKQYQDKINKASTEGEKLTLGKQRDKILSDLDEQANKTTSAISQLFGDMKDKTLKDLEAINSAGQKALEFLKSGQWDEQKGKEFGITKENFEIWSNDPEKIKAITDALLNNKKVAEELRPTYDKIADGLKKIFNSGNDTKKLDEALNDLRNGLSEILQVGSFLSDTFSSLGESFGANAFSGIAEGINVAMDSLNSAMQGAEAGSIFGPVGSAVGATVGFVSSISSAFAKIHDKKNEKQIQKLQKQIDVLKESYDKLGESVEKAYSKDASELIGQQNEMLEQQKVLIEQQIKEEKDKKDTDKKRIEEWENQIDEINDAIKDNKEKAVDAIFGEDLKTAIENFASAYADAWSNGEDRAESAKETVKSMMRQMVTESIKSAIQASGSMEKIRQKLQEFYADNVLSGWEQDYIYNMAEEIQKELDKQFGWADDLFEEDSSKQQSASSRGFGTEMTHEDAGELSGRFTAVYESNLRIETAEQQQTVAITQLTGSISALTSQASGMYNIADETRTILANSYLELQQIRENTGEIVKPIKQIQADIAEVKRNTSRL